MKDRAPQLPARYRVVRQLGAGGMGEVYEAEDLELGRTVALKLLRGHFASSPDVRARFAREALAQAKVDHPNLLRIFDSRLEGEEVYLAMELVEGHDLSVLLQKHGPLSHFQVARMARELGGALDALHAAGVVHRDLKPSNVMVRDRDGSAVLMDLGLAAVSDATALTRTGAMIGTPVYLPPELLRGDSMTAASDQYQLAAVLYEALTGSRVAEGRDLLEVSANILEGRRPAAQPGHELTADLKEVLDRGLAVDPTLRFPSCVDLAAGMTAAAGGDSGVLETEYLERAPGSGGEASVGGATVEPREVAPRRPGASRGRVLLALACFLLLGVLLPRGAGPPSAIEFEVIGDAARVRFSRSVGTGVSLEVDGRRAGAELEPGTGRYTCVVRGLAPGRRASARLTWPGGGLLERELEGGRPAVDLPALPAGPDRIRLTVRRRVEVRWQAPGSEPAVLTPESPWLHTPPGFLRGDVQLTWKEGGIPFQPEMSRGGWAATLVAGLREVEGDADPDAALKAESRGGSPATFDRTRSLWRDAAPWIPALLVGTEDRATVGWLWARWEIWCRAQAQEQALGRDLVGLEVAAPLPGAHGLGGPPAGWSSVPCALEPLDGDDPRRRDGGLKMTSATAKARLRGREHTDAASAATFQWPATPPRAGAVVAVTIPTSSWYERTQAILRPRAGGGTTLLLWHPRPGYKSLEKYRGQLTTYLPRALAPPAGTEMLLEIADLLEFTAFNNRLSPPVVSFAPSDETDR